jgi:UDP-N-acetylmuramate--alanine ligase
VARRLELKGLRNGARIYDDYGHHPTEVRAALEALRGLEPRRLVAVFQPHLYSRTQDQAEAFGRSLLGADMAVVTDVYPSREKPIPGVTGELVVDAARRGGHRNVHYCPAWKDAPELLRGLQGEAGVGPGDVVITLGAGDVNRLAETLVVQEQEKQEAQG